MKETKKKKSRLFSFRYLMHDIIRITASIGLIWYRPKHLYLDKKYKKIRKGAIVSSNHISLEDPIRLMMGIWYRRLHMVAMDELFGTGFRRHMFKTWFQCIPISRENFSMSSFKEIVEHLDHNEVVIIFPEGRVNTDPKGIKAFKSGMLMMALKSDVPIVPVYLKRKKHFYSRVVIAIGTPIYVKNYNTNGVTTIQDFDRAIEDIQKMEKELENLCYQKEKKQDE